MLKYNNKWDQLDLKVKEIQLISSLIDSGIDEVELLNTIIDIHNRAFNKGKNKVLVEWGERFEF